MRTPRTLGAAVAAVLLALVGSLVVAAPAHAGTAPVTIDVIAKATSKKAIYNDGKGPYLGDAERVAVGGLVTSGGEPVVGEPVHLQRRLKGSDAWVSVGTRYTNGDGEVQVAVDAAGPATYRLFFDGSAHTTYASAYSAARNVKIMRDLNATYAQKGNKLVLKGKVTPKWNKKKVLLERKTSKKAKWKVVKKARTNKRGGWSFRLGAPRTGEWFYRAVVPKKNGFVKSYSHIRVKTWTW